MPAVPARCRRPAHRRSPASRPRRPPTRGRAPRRPAANPTALVIGRSRRQKACAATPAHSALRLLRAATAGPSTVAGSSGRARRTGPASADGAAPAGSAGRRRRTGRRSASAIGSNTRRHRVTVGARGLGRCDRSIGSSTPAEPSSSGWAQSTSAASQVSPWDAGRARRGSGEAAAIGWNAEQWSCTSPGTSHLRAARPAADRVGRLEHGHVEAGAGQPRRGGEPVGPAADDDRRVTAHRRHRDRPRPSTSALGRRCRDGRPPGATYARAAST